MKHSFKLKTSELKSLFKEKLEFKSLSIDSDTDVYDSVNTLLHFINLENHLSPSECTYSYLNNNIKFKLQLNSERQKKDFFTSIKTFEDFLMN